MGSLRTLHKKPLTTQNMPGIITFIKMVQAGDIQFVRKLIKEDPETVEEMPKGRFRQASIPAIVNPSMPKFVKMLKTVFLVPQKIYIYFYSR